MRRITTITFQYKQLAGLLNTEEVGADGDQGTLPDGQNGFDPEALRTALGQSGFPNVEIGSSPQAALMDLNHLDGATVRRTKKGLHKAVFLIYLNAPSSCPNRTSAAVRCSIPLAKEPTAGARRNSADIARLVLTLPFSWPWPGCRS
ncbi:hypothetical protein D3C73_962640 [compost metagenome]